MRIGDMDMLHDVLATINAAIREDRIADDEILALLARRARYLVGSTRPVNRGHRASAFTLRAIVFSC